MRRWLGIVLCFAAASTACGGHSAPTAPSTSTSSSSSAGAATINGTVQGAGASALTAASGGAALTGVIVSIVGTSISSGVDAVGRFTLTNVPPGNVQLRISGGGIDATVSLSPVQAAETVEVVVTVSGNTANLESEVRNGAGEGELEGRVESLPPMTPSLTFKAAGRMVTTDASTRFVDGSQTRSFSDLQIGMRVHVKGRMSGDTFAATSVEMQNSKTTIQVEVNGAIDTVTGSASTFQFKIGSRVIKGDDTTTFVGDGNTPASFASLKDGVRVEVKGEQRDAFIFATRIHVEDETDDNEAAEASVQGVVKAISGSAPNLTLTVNSTTVHTSGSTQVTSHGNVLTLDALKIDQTVEVEGTRQPDGSIAAKKIGIEDEANEVEMEGTLTNLTGSCPAIHFSVNSTAVVASAATRFDNASCSTLKNNDQVEVRGTKQTDGSINATRIKKK